MRSGRLAWALIPGLLLSGVAAAEPCAGPVSAAEIDKLVAQVDVAFVASDTDAIVPLAAQVRDSLPCVDSLLDGRQVGGVHRVLALEAFISRDKAGSQAYLAALRSSDPSYALPEFLPAAHPLRADFAALVLEEAPTSPLPQPESGRLWVNGKVAERRPDSWPAVVQWERPRGKLGLTELMMPGDEAPDYPTATAIANNGTGDGTEDPKPPKEPHEGPRWALVGAGGGALLVSGGLGLWASASAEDWRGCAGQDVAGCVKANEKGAEAAWKGEPGWDSLSPFVQRIETLRYGADDAAATNKLAGGLALGAAVLGAGLITVGFVW